VPYASPVLFMWRTLTRDHLPVTLAAHNLHRAHAQVRRGGVVVDEHDGICGRAKLIQCLVEDRPLVSPPLTRR